MDMPPPSLPVKRPTKRAPLPAVPRGFDQTTQPQLPQTSQTQTNTQSETTSDTPAEPSHTNGSASASASASAASSAASATASASLPPPPPAAAAALPSSVYTVPLWSSAPIADTWSLEVLKGGHIFSIIPLSGRSHFLFGRQGDLCHIVLDHPSVSRRHAIFQFHENGTLWLYDLTTSHGTFINKKKVPSSTFQQLHVGDQVQFGGSSRTYVVQGPEEFQTKEFDREVMRKQKEKMREQYAKRQAEQQQQQQQSAGAAVSSDVDAGASWGQSADAVDSDDDDEGKVMVLNDDGSTSIVVNSSTPPSVPTKLTPQQQKCLTKLETKREKFTHLSQEVEVLRSKDIRQGGLTLGQEKQIEKNEERMKVLQEEMVELETQLRENVERVEKDRLKNQTNAKNSTSRKTNGSDEDYESEDDDFYDRTKSKSMTTSSSSNNSTTVASTSILSTLTPLEQLTTPDQIRQELKRIETKRDQLRLNLQEVVMSEARLARMNGGTTTNGGSGGGGDSLDSFMSSINTSALVSKKSSLKTSLQELQAHHIKLQRLIEQKEGELKTKRYLEGDKEAFKKSTNMTTTATAIGPQPMNIDASATTSTPTVTPTTAPSAPRPATGPAAAATAGTADALARLKKKQEAAARKQAEHQAKLDKIEEMKRAIEDATTPNKVTTSTGASGTVKAFATDAPTNAADRYAMLAQQLESARDSIHRKYDAVPDDDVSRALKSSAERSAASMSTGQRSNDERGGLHVRKRVADEDGHDPYGASKRTKVHDGSPTFRPTGPMDFQPQSEETSVEWVAPTTAAAGQDKLRAKFAGRY